MKGIYEFTSDALNESIQRREAKKMLDENCNEDNRPKIEFFIDILINNKNFSHEEILEHLGMLIITIETCVTGKKSPNFFTFIHR